MVLKILDDLISILDFDAIVRDIRQGVFHTGVLTRNCGLAATLPRDALRQEPPMVKEPGFLLDHGFNAISGTKVMNAELALRCVSQGANYRQIKGIKRLTMIR